MTDRFPFLPLHWTDCESALRSVPNVDKECNGRASGPSIALQAHVCKGFVVYVVNPRDVYYYARASATHAASAAGRWSA